jgi:hypothetical protein
MASLESLWGVSSTLPVIIRMQKELERTIIHGDAEDVVKAIATFSGNINSIISLGRTPLTLCIDVGSIQGVRAICRRPDLLVEGEDDNGWTPLGYAARMGNGTVAALISHFPGINVDERMSKRSDWTALHAAVYHGSYDEVKVKGSHFTADAAEGVHWRSTKHVSKCERGDTKSCSASRTPCIFPLDSTARREAKAWHIVEHWHRSRTSLSAAPFVVSGWACIFRTDSVATRSIDDISGCKRHDGGGSSLHALTQLHTYVYRGGA